MGSVIFDLIWVDKEKIINMANALIDEFITSEDEVIGKVDYVIKYIGFPTLWANELFRKG